GKAMRTWDSRAILLTVLIAGASVTRSLAASVDDEYLLQRTVKVGESDKYKTNLKIQGNGPNGPLNFEVNMISTDRISELKPNGEYVETITIESGTINVNGSERPSPAAGQSITITYDKMGRMISNSAPTSGRGSMVAQLMPIPRMGFLSDRPIKIGQSARYET